MTALKNKLEPLKTSLGALENQDTFESLQERIESLENSALGTTSYRDEDALAAI